jgi:acyl carrier protein
VSALGDDEIIDALHRAAAVISGREVSRPTLADRIENLGVDSLEMVEIVLLCEQRLRRYIVSGIEEFVSIGDVVDALKNGDPFPFET